MVLDDVSVSVASGYIGSMAGYDWGMDVAAWDRVWFGKRRRDSSHNRICVRAYLR